MSRGNQRYPVHLVGSFPLGSAEKVFRTVAQSGIELVRIPDGETGGRRLFMLWQGEQAFANNRAFYQAERSLKPQKLRPYKLHLWTDIDFPSLGYAEAARDSYEVFCRLREEGVIQPGVRFQVSLPSPLNTLATLLTKPDVARVEPAYEAAMLAEVDQIVEAIPSEDLAIQWDIPYEVRAWFGSIPAFMLKPWFDNPHEEIINRLTRLGERVPPPVELGYHLCYGDAAHNDNLFFMLVKPPKSELIRGLVSRTLNRLGKKFAAPPSDASPTVEIASALTSSATRPINYFHFPVPPWADHTYLALLAKLKRRDYTEVILGLIDLSDGYEGSRHRIAAAEEVLGSNFGIASGCGLGRYNPEDIAPLLSLHRALAQPERGISGSITWKPPQFRSDEPTTRKSEPSMGLNPRPRNYDHGLEQGAYSSKLAMRPSQRRKPQATE